jgi:ABC-type antimicrobial peptide transport system permease subunit
MFRTFFSHVAFCERREICIRTALGAAQSRVVRLLLIESLLLGLSAGAVGRALAAVALHLFALYGPEELIRGPQPAMNFWVLLFSLALSLATSLVFGLAPAIAISRVDLAESLKERSRGSDRAPARTTPIPRGV